MGKTVKILVDKVNADLYILRINDDRIKYFEGIWEITEGITYNAYLLTGKEGVVVFDTWRDRYADEFVNTLSSIADPKDITHIIVHHMEPDHSGALPRVLEENGYRLEVLGHPIVKGMIESFYGIKPKFRPVIDGEEFILGGKRIRFIHTPLLHWPDTIMSFIVDEGVLLSGDAFGGYSIPSTIFDEEEAVVEFINFAREYFATIIGKYRANVLKSIEKLKSLGITPRVIAPLHGLVWRRSPETILNYYERWARALPEKGKILVVYSSMYGFTEEAATIAVEELSRNGYRPVIFRFTDKHYDPVGDVIGEAIDAEGLVVAASTYEADLFPYMRYVVSLIIEKVEAEKPVLILSSYGWGGVAGKKLAQLFENSKFRVVEVVEFKGKPAGQDIDRIRAGVKALIEDLTQ